MHGLKLDHPSRLDNTGLADRVRSHGFQQTAAPPPARNQQCQRRRRWRLLPPASCASQAGNTSDGAHHFLRPSLLATGLTEPQDVLQHCLALFRKADLAGLQQYLPGSYSAAVDAANSSSSSSSSGSSPGLASVPVGPWLQVVEQGPLAPLVGLLDVGSRRVLPGHLLRRSQVLSTLRPSPDTFQQRVALTACAGETSVFDWLLQWRPEVSKSAKAGGSSSGSSDAAAAAAGSGGGRWVLVSVRRDASTDVPLPTTPHPQAAPEAVVKAQLAALQEGDVFGASCYNMWHRKGLTSRKTSLGFHHDALRAKLQQQPYSLLVGHAGVQLGGAALPTQREQLQHVSVLAPDGTSAQFVWRLGMSTHGCWMASGIFSAEELAGGPQQERQQ